MQYQSTVFGQLLKAVPRGWFDRVARKHRSGRVKRQLSAWGHLVTMVGAHFCGARSLRDLERALERQPGAMAHLGLGRVARATLADANAGRPAALFEEVAAKLCGDLGGGSKLGREALRLIDATRIYAGKRAEAWARGGVKLHLSFEPAQQRPVWFAVTRDRVNDITPAKSMPIEAEATYVFDKGYYDFSFWAKLHEQGCRFVTRLKKNSPVRPVSARKTKGEGILFDRVVRLSERLSSQRQNPFQAKVRLVGVKLDASREITLLTNDLKAPATEIAALYKARWQIELFFKWIKQNLKLTHFLGSSQNALTIQIMAALIAYLLIRAAALRDKASLALQAAVRLMPSLLFARRPLGQVIGQRDPPPTKPTPPPQLQFAYA